MPIQIHNARRPAGLPGRAAALAMALALSALTLSAANAPVVTSVIKPQKIVQTTGGGKRTYFIDFGPAYFGSVSFRLANSGSPENAQIDISEAASGTDIITNATGARSSSASFSVASGSHDYSQFTDRPIHACRISVPDPAVSLDTSTIALIAKHVPFDDSASSFTSSDPMLDRVYALCKHTVKATSYQGVYLDGIRETKPYEGDAYINMLGHLGSDANPPIALFTHEYLLTHPTWPWEYGLTSILIGWEFYMATGDSAQLRRNYSVLASRIQTRIGSGSWTDSTPIVDWPITMRDGYDSLSKGWVVANAWAYKSLMTIADMADALGKPSEATAYRARAAQTKTRINTDLLIKGQNLYRDGIGSSHVSLHGNLYPLAFGIVPDSLKKTVGKYLAGRGMACNVYGAQFLLDALFEAGYDSAAVALMTAKTMNSWGHMMDVVGSTLTMEAWDPSQKPNLDWNHAWGAAPANIVPRRLFGILPLSPGYGKFMIKPQPGTLSSGAYTLPTVKGTIKVSFESRKGQSLVITADIPAAAFAKVYLPVFASATDEILVDNVVRTGVREGDFLSVDSIPAGHHVLGRGVTVGMRPPRPASRPLPGIAIQGGMQCARFHFTGERSGPAAVAIYDLGGKRVQAFGIGPEADRIVSLPPGLYVYAVRYPGEKPIEAKFLVR